MPPGNRNRSATFHDLLDDVDRRALTPLFWTHINPYGRFRLDMDTRLNLVGTDPSSVTAGNR